jgi:hypothetical protein
MPILRIGNNSLALPKRGSAAAQTKRKEEAAAKKLNDWRVITQRNDK